MMIFKKALFVWIPKYSSTSRSIKTKLLIRGRQQSRDALFCSISLSQLQTLSWRYRCTHSSVTMRHTHYVKHLFSSNYINTSSFFSKTILRSITASQKALSTLTLALYIWVSSFCPVRLSDDLNRCIDLLFRLSHQWYRKSCWPWFEWWRLHRRRRYIVFIHLSVTHILSFSFSIGFLSKLERKTHIDFNGDNIIGRLPDVYYGGYPSMYGGYPSMYGGYGYSRIPYGGFY